MLTSEYQIVCVDDDLDVLSVTEGQIKALGQKVIAFNKVDQAVEYIKINKSKIMLIVSDLRMDDINGFGFKKILRESGIEIPFVIITGYWTKEMSMEAMALGVDAFMEKPVTMELLQDNITKFGLPRLEQLQEEKEMVCGFLDESGPMLDEIESLILELEEDPSNEQTLSVYFRLLHTIKGTASCVGLTNLGHYTHKYEDFIGDLRNKKIPVNTQSTNVLLKGLDDLKTFFQQVEHDGNDSDLNFQERMAIFDAGLVMKSQQMEEETTQVQTASSSDHTKEIKDKKEEDKMSVSMNILNDFMEESGELTVIRNSILKTVRKIESKYRGDQEIENLNELLSAMYNVTSNIQGKITEMRKVPLSNTFRPFKRLVRDLSKKLNKKVDLEIIGEELLVDNIVAKLYSNTLIHIVRNSLDHGLETPEKRKSSGKSEVGKIVFKVTETGEDIILQISDDGNGINPDIIKKKALEKGLFTAEQLNNMTPTEIVNIIFASGFSTAEQVSDLSGRGVGMDMVRGSFENMGGHLYVQSKVGEGSVFTLSVPLPKSVLIINSLSVSAGGQCFIFPMDVVSEVIRYEKELPHSKLYNIDGEKIISHNGDMIQIMALDHVLNLNHSQRHLDGAINLVVLKAGKTKFAVEVDQIHEFEEVVCRKIPAMIDKNHIYQGASLLGSGEAAMILDAQGLANFIGIDTLSSSKHVLPDENAASNNQIVAEYMLFKYDQDNYLSIELDQVFRLETMETNHFEKVGSHTVIKYLNRPLLLIDPAYVLGLKQECCFDRFGSDKREDVSVIVVNDSSGGKLGLMVHRLDEIQYSYEAMNSDTIDVEGLKGSVYLKGHTISVLDIDVIAMMVKKRKVIISDIEASEIEHQEKYAA
jgi:two-component system, chemotaxis family, sensor kinase CheA